MLFEQIETNKRKTFFIIVIFLLLVELIGVCASYFMFNDFLSGAIFSFIFMVVYIPIAIHSGNKIVLRMNRAKKIMHSKQAPHLWNSIEGLAMAAQIPMPEIYIIEEGSPNAFATGFSPDKSAIAVTTGLLKKLNREEIEAVMAHEIAHIRNYDVRLTTISMALVTIITVISDFGTRFIIPSSKENRNPFLLLISLIILVLAPIISMIMFYSLSQNREFLADASGAELCRNPLALASALDKIANDPDPMEHVSPAMAGIYFSEPLKLPHDKKKQGFFSKLFSTHPSTDERIKRLREM